ncbi:hypothetical protein CXF70_14395 [Planomicrobium sp. MB-3u-38]|nr:hypothetical protein CXF70_14395 [Planomicrobium sp. MB-3u-38]
MPTGAIRRVVFSAYCGRQGVPYVDGTSFATSLRRSIILALSKVPKRMEIVYFNSTIQIAITVNFASLYFIMKERMKKSAGTFQRFNRIHERA